MSGFPIKKTLDDFDFSFQPSIDKRQIDELVTMRFLENGENVVFFGPPGVGKTHLASALGLVAAQHRFSTYYVNCYQLIEQLKRPTLRTACQTSSGFCPSTGCSSLTRLVIFPWIFRASICFSSLLPGGMKNVYRPYFQQDLLPVERGLVRHYHCLRHPGSGFTPLYRDQHQRRVL